ncbi:MAG: PAS domain S-box protein [Ignavibacteria bacterium]|jgi:PAS domain S-box-containing protein|nr:PAS domain S-box protein [Ignavibacteria bacterium]
MLEFNIKSTIHKKVIILLLSLAALFIIALNILKDSETEKVKMLIRDEENEHAALLENSVRKLGEGLYTFTDDYSRWDEMMVFMKKHQDKWAEINIDAAFPTFNIQAFWLFDTNFQLKYSKNTLKGTLSEILPVHDRKFREFIKANPFCHFYTKTPYGILEICGNPVQPTEDLSRKSQPQGYLFAGRLWSQKQLQEISALISDSLTIGDAASTKKEKGRKDYLSIENSKKLPGWDKKTVAVIKARKEYPIFKKVFIWAYIQYISMIIFTFVMLLCISVFLYYTVNQPLSAISGGLRTGAMGFLDKLKKRKDEFGELALLMEEFYKQKQILENEIKSRENAESELRKIKDGLEVSVEKRTIELAGVNEKLEQEITERKKVEKSLQDFHKRLTGAFFGNPDSINISRLSDGMIIDTNESFCRLTGYSKEELLGKTTLQLKLWVRPREREKMVERLLSNETVSNLEAEFRTKEGSLKAVSISITLMEYADEKALLFMIRDVTERKRVESELVEYKQQLEGQIEQRNNKLSELNKSLSEQIGKVEKADNEITDLIIFFKTLLDTIPIPILIQDVNNRYTNCNYIAEEFFGIQKKELIESLSGGSSLISGNDNDLHPADAKLLNERTFQKLESNVILANGETRNVIIYRSLYKRKNDQPGGIITAIFDITDRKKNEVELLKTLEKEKELNDLKSRFISTASHQFRTPLATIQSSTDLLDMFGRKWPKEKYNEQLAIIQDQIRQMIELLNDVLTVSRAEAGKVEFQPSLCNLHQLCLTAFNEAKSLANEYHSFALDYKMSEEDFYIDRKLLKYILSNLLGNAVKYTLKKGEIRLTVEREEGLLAIEVSDQGIGIPAKDMINLFEPFYRAENAGNLPGTGLGLSIVKKSVELHGGEIFCRSNVDEGTTFRVILPVIDYHGEVVS